MLKGRLMLKPTAIIWGGRIRRNVPGYPGTQGYPGYEKFPGTPMGTHGTRVPGYPDIWVHVHERVIS
eukprot:2796710-Rhodomonas_salina.3